MSLEGSGEGEPGLWLVLLGGAGTAVAQLVTYIETLGGRYDASGMIAFWSTWVAGVGLLAVAALRRDDDVGTRAALAFFGVVTLLLVGGGPEALYDLGAFPFG